MIMCYINKLFSISLPSLSCLSLSLSLYSLPLSLVSFFSVPSLAFVFLFILSFCLSWHFSLSILLFPIMAISCLSVLPLALSFSFLSLCIFCFFLSPSCLSTSLPSLSSSVLLFPLFLLSLSQGLVIERVGRKLLLIFGFFAMALCFSLLTIFLNFQVS